MRKPLLIGAGLGLLVLALMAGRVWLAGSPSPSDANTEGKAVRSAPVASPAGVVPAAPALAPAALQTAPSEATQDRRRRMAEVRAEFNALRAQGINASPEKLQAVVNEMEALSPPGFDPRYFQTLRSMLKASARVQALNDELQALSKGTAPKEAARREEIYAELRKLAEQVSAEARNLQSYAPTSPPGQKSP